MVNEAPNNGSGVAVVESDKPADTAEGAIRPLRLTQRLAAIRADASGISKEDLKMGTFHITAHTIEGVLHGVRVLLDRHGVWMEMGLVEREYQGNRCDALFDFRFENMDDAADTRTIRYAGAGTDNSDKAFAKAGTNALKEMLKKTFLITDREDAKEESDRVEHEAEGATRKEVAAAKEDTRAALEQWAKSTKLAIEAAPDLKALARVQRDNRDQLTHESLPEVTRTFFVELIERRKAELETPEAKGA